MTNWYDNVPAPTDASGRVVPLDTMELVYKGETREVWSIIYNIERGCWSVSFGWFDSVDISACTLPDSWKRLEKDALKNPCEYFGLDRTSSCDGCPAKPDDDNLALFCDSGNLCFSYVYSGEQIDVYTD